MLEFVTKNGNLENFPSEKSMCEDGLWNQEQTLSEIQNWSTNGLPMTYDPIFLKLI